MEKWGRRRRRRRRRGGGCRRVTSSERQTLKLSPCVFFVFWLVSCCSRLIGYIKWTHASFLQLVAATSTLKGMRKGERVFESGRTQGRRERESERERGSPASRDEWRDGWFLLPWGAATEIRRSICFQGGWIL
jgi:hypothetical protein